MALDGKVFCKLAGRPIVTVLDSVPEKSALIVPLTVMVITPPSGTVIVVLISADPLALPQIAPPVPPQVQITEPSSLSGLATRHYDIEC